MDFVWGLAEHISKMRFENLSEHTVGVADRFILDTIGAAISGSSASGVKEIVEQMIEWGGKGQSKIIGFGIRVPDLNATFANSVMVHARDFDDTHDAAVVHANVTVLPAVMALSEEIGGIGGKDFLTAVVLGIDLSCRLGMAIGEAPGFSEQGRGWVRTTVCGIFGATAAACKVLKMQKEQVIDAFGIALSQVGGTRQAVTDSALTKRMQPAFMAKSAVFSTLLAKRGITGCKNVFEGTYGYFNLYWGGDYVRQELLRGLGERFEMDQLSFKPYPCCRYTHGAIEATLKIINREKISSNLVEEVNVHLVKHKFFDMVSRPFEIRGNPQVDAQFSIPYTVASAILDGYVFLDSFEPEKVRERAQNPLLKKLKVFMDKPIENPKSLGPVRVEIKTKSGKVFFETVKDFKGHPNNTMTEEECRDKFLNCSRYSLNPYSKASLEMIMERVLSLERLKNTNDLVELL